MSYIWDDSAVQRNSYQAIFSVIILIMCSSLVTWAIISDERQSHEAALEKTRIHEVLVEQERLRKLDHRKGQKGEVDRVEVLDESTIIIYFKHGAILKLACYVSPGSQIEIPLNKPITVLFNGFGVFVECASHDWTPTTQDDFSELPIMLDRK